MQKCSEESVAYHSQDGCKARVKGHNLGRMVAREQHESEARELATTSSPAISNGRVQPDAFAYRVSKRKYTASFYHLKGN